MVRKPVLHEASRVRMMSREGADLFFRQVFVVSKDDQRSVNIDHTVYPEEAYRGWLGSLTACKCSMRSSRPCCFKPILTVSLASDGAGPRTSQPLGAPLTHSCFTSKSSQRLCGCWHNVAPTRSESVRIFCDDGESSSTHSKLVRDLASWSPAQLIISYLGSCVAILAGTAPGQAIQLPPISLSASADRPTDLKGLKLSSGMLRIHAYSNASGREFTERRGSTSEPLVWDPLQDVASVHPHTALSRPSFC